MFSWAVARPAGRFPIGVCLSVSVFVGISGLDTTLAIVQSVSGHYCSIESRSISFILASPYLGYDTDVFYVLSPPFVRSTILLRPLLKRSSLLLPFSHIAPRKTLSPKVKRGKFLRPPTHPTIYDLLPEGNQNEITCYLKHGFRSGRGLYPSLNNSDHVTIPDFGIPIHTRYPKRMICNTRAR